MNSAGATDLNFGFSTYWLPPGATLHVSSAIEDYWQPAYTEANNQDHGQLWTAMVPGETAVLELFVPAGITEQPRLLLAQVSTGYRDFFHHKTDDPVNGPKSGACEVDVVCPVGAPWANEIRSAAVYTRDGAWTCSGTMVMDAPGDFRSYFLTANHCGINSGNAASVVVYWNFQSPTCGQHGGGSLNQNQSGSTFRASRFDVDFCLVELSARPSAAYNVYYSGWERTGTAPPGVVGIHHPNCDEKSISFSSNAVTSVDSCIGTGGINSHWDVVWGLGVTEPGSSGSGIWNLATHKLTGFLSGGDSSCTIPLGPDCYGKFSAAWDGTSASSRLRDWLDPSSTGVMSIAGADATPQAQVQLIASALTSESCAPTNGVLDPGELVGLTFTLSNLGTAPVTNLVVSLLATNGVTSPSATQVFGPLGIGSSVSPTFSCIVTGTCGSALETVLEVKDGTRTLAQFRPTWQMGTPATSLAEDFDSTSIGGLPDLWSAAPSYGWYADSTHYDTPFNSAYSYTTDYPSDFQLQSPVVAIASASSKLRFRHYYYVEDGFDGGVLEISIDGGAFQDIVAAGGSFESGGYDDLISLGYDSAIAGRMAWTGNSGGFKTTQVRLPASAVGHNVQFMWRLVSDESYTYNGWSVDAVSVLTGYVCCQGATAPILNALNFANGIFQFTVTGAPGGTYRLLASPNLVNWTPVTTNTAPFVFSVNVPPGVPPQFYRAQSVP